MELRARISAPSTSMIFPVAMDFKKTSGGKGWMVKPAINKGYMYKVGRWWGFGMVGDVLFGGEWGSWRINMVTIYHGICKTSLRIMMD